MLDNTNMGVGTVDLTIHIYYTECLANVFVALNCDVTGIWLTRFQFGNSNA